MSHDEQPADATLAEDLRDSLSGLAVPGPPPLAAISRRGREHRWRRLAGSAALGTTGAAAGVALALALTGVFSGDPARDAGTIQTAAFTLTSNRDGTKSLTLKQVFDPAALQRALTKAGVASLVKTGSYCSSSPAVPAPYLFGVLPGQVPPAPHLRGEPPGGAPGMIEGGLFPVKPSELSPRIADTVSLQINPTVMPPRTELYVGYFNSDGTLFFNLIYTGAHTCRSAPDPPPGSVATQSNHTNPR